MDMERKVKSFSSLRLIRSDPLHQLYQTTEPSINASAQKCFGLRIENIMYILAAVCLLGFASAQKVTELTHCMMDNHLRMDCTYELSPATPIPTCLFTQDKKVVASTNNSYTQELYKNGATATILEGQNICRLNVTTFADDKPKNFTCTIKQKDTNSKIVAVEKGTAPTCSAWGLQSSGLVMFSSIVFLLEAKWQ
ncbi:hypothetical protein DPEC_G00234650 [Dallia pectoralis]|uniref:Uncharacterized protein n=1 Tax=Dallia pectoralis TaxID=75939 RepID=A0ACC2FXV3_DALPE|nr:hypothetical protein DPEC_G00234650 [Dallia pectoralis]